MTNPLYSLSSLPLLYVPPMENLKVPFQTVILICKAAQCYKSVIFLRVSECLKIDLYIS